MIHSCTNLVSLVATDGAAVCLLSDKKPGVGNVTHIPFFCMILCSDMVRKKNARVKENHGHKFYRSFVF